MMIWHHRKQLSGKKVLLYIDNQSVMYSIFKHWSSSDKLMEFIQELILIMCCYCIDVHVNYIPTKMNDGADALSRDQLDRFHELVDLYGWEINEQMDDVDYYNDLKLLKGRAVPTIDYNAIMAQICGK